MWDGLREGKRDDTEYLYYLGIELRKYEVDGEPLFGVEE
jgi:hypothetical protein